MRKIPAGGGSISRLMNIIPLIPELSSQYSFSYYPSIPTSWASLPVTS